MELTYEEVIALKESGEKNVWVVLAEKYGKSKDSIRSWFNRERTKRQAFEALLDNEPEVEVAPQSTTLEEKEYPAEKQTSFDDEGNVRSISSKRVVAMDEEQEKSVEFVLKAHGFEPSEWTVVNLINNYWQGLRKNDQGAITLYQSKLTVKPKVENRQITLDDVEYFFNNFEPNKVSPSNYVRKDNSGGTTLLVNLADAHFGNDEDGFSVRDAVLELVEEIRYRAMNSNIREIYLINLGDILHVDGYAGQTTSGTQVGLRGAYYGIWDNALQTMIEAIDRLKEVAPVRYISINGNHDKVSSFTLSKAIECYFVNDVNVETDVDFAERKYIEVGKSLFGLVHGDLPSKNIPSVLQREAREAYGRCSYAYVLLGHLHHTNIVDKDGVIISHLPSITAIDGWHKGEGYTGSWRGTLCYVVHDTDGIIDTWHIKS